MQPLLVLLCCLTLPAKASESPFNDLTLSQAEKADSYSFEVGGHLYGASKNHNSVFPSSSFLGNIDRINSSNISFFVSLGDNFRRATEEHIVHFKSAVASRLKMPFFNAVGNHDVTNRERYEAHFGKTYYCITFRASDSRTATACQRTQKFITVAKQPLKVLFRSFLRSIE